MQKRKKYNANETDLSSNTSGVRRKFSWGGFHSVTYGGHLCLVCAVCDVIIWRHFYVSKPAFRRCLL